MKSSSRPVLYSLNDRSAAAYNDLTGVWRMTAPKYLLCQGAADTKAPQVLHSSVYLSPLRRSSTKPQKLQVC